MKQCAFARAGCALQGEEFAALHDHADAAQDEHVALARGVALVQIARHDISIGAHSWRRASTGFKRAALQAGINPASKLINRDPPQMSKISCGLMRAGSSEKA